MRILRVLFKLFLGLFLTLFLLIAVGIGTLFYVLDKPEVTIPERSMRWVAEKFLKPIDINVSFKSFQAQILKLEGAEWYQRQIVVRSEELKVAMPDLFSTEIPDIDLHVEVNFHPKRYGIRAVGPIDISGAKVLVKLPKPDPKAKDEPFDTKLWLERIRHTRFQPVRIGLASLTIERPGEPTLSGSLYIALQRQEGNRWTFGVRADRLKGTPVNRANFDLAVDLPETDQLLPLSLLIKGRADLAKFGWAQLSGDGRVDNPEKGQFRLDLLSNVEGQRQKIKASGKLDGERFQIAVSGNATHPLDVLQLIEVPSCELGGYLRQKRKPFLESNLNCRISLTRIPAPQEKPFQDMLPKTFSLAIAGPISIPSWDKNPSFEAPLKISLTPLKSELYTLSGQTSVKLSGKVLGGMQDLNAEIDVDSQLVLDRFQGVVRRLSETDFSVPAPFNTLDGRIYCNVQGRIRKMGSVIDLPLECGTELISETQSMFIVAKGAVVKDDKQKPVIRLDIGLNKLTFELPKLALNGTVPQIFPDKRIVKASEWAKETAAAQALPVILDLRITTPADRPLTLITSLQPKPIPITIDLTVKGESFDPVGRISILNYRVSFLKKKALVDHLAIVLVPDEPQPLIDGLVAFDDPDVRIFLKVSGTVDRPFYELESQPPRNPTELLSIVLFGGDAEALDDDNLQSVEETRAAMVDGAIGLVSMYYLASTPIDSVGYNPHTGLFRARVKVAQGLSLTVGSDLGGARQSIALRKRLTENWSFETGAETDEETKKNKGVAMFKWGRRY